MILPIVEVEPSRKGRMDSVNSLELAACTFNNCSTLQLARIISQNVTSHLPTMLHARFLTLNYSSHKLQQDTIQSKSKLRMFTIFVGVLSICLNAPPLPWTAEVIWWRNDYWKAMTYTPPRTAPSSRSSA